MKAILLCITFLLTASCVANSSHFTKAKVLTRGIDDANSLCEKFNLNEQEALEFFKKAKVVNQKTIHDHYDYLPCYVKGTISFPPKDSKRTEEMCGFTIRAGGTAELACGKEDVKFYACNNYENLLRDKP